MAGVSQSWDNDKLPQKDDDPEESAGWDKDKTKEDGGQARKSSSGGR